MSISVNKGILLAIAAIAAFGAAIVLFFMVRAYLRFNRFEGYKEGLEQQFLFDAKRLRHQLTNNLLDGLACRISSWKYGQNVPLSEEQAVQARKVLIDLLSCRQMRPSFLRMSKHRIAAMGSIDFFSTVEDAEHNRDSVVSIAYYESPDAVRIRAAKRFDICDIEILLDDKIHAEIKELIEKTVRETSRSKKVEKGDNADFDKPSGRK